jgi:rRNA maturation endonuclease Nob1
MARIPNQRQYSCMGCGQIFSEIDSACSISCCIHCGSPHISICVDSYEDDVEEQKE